MSTPYFPLSLEETAKIVEIGEMVAWRDLCMTAPPEWASTFGLRAETVGTACAFLLQGVDSPLFNRVLGLGIEELATEAELEHILTLYKQAGISRFHLQVSPAALPSELPSWLKARNFCRQGNWSILLRGTEPLPVLPTNFTVRTVGPEQASGFATTLQQGYGTPGILNSWIVASVGRFGWRHYLVYAGEQPVACGAMFILGNVAWLGLAATLPSHRRQGAQSALLTHRLREGMHAGCRWFVTETVEDLPEHPNPSYHNMIRAGFQEVYLRPNYQKI